MDIANDCRTGLASYFYSGDVAQCWRVGSRLHELFSYLLYELEGKKTKLSNQSRRHFAQFTMNAPWRDTRTSTTEKIMSCCQRWGRLCRPGWSESTRGWSLRRRRRSGGSRSPDLEERGPGEIIRIQVDPFWSFEGRTWCLDFNILISATASTTTQTSNICALATSKRAISSQKIVIYPHWQVASTLVLNLELHPVLTLLLPQPSSASKYTVLSKAVFYWKCYKTCIPCTVLFWHALYFAVVSNYQCHPGPSMLY